MSDRAIPYYRVPDTLAISKPSLDMLACVNECKHLDKTFRKTVYHKAEFILFESLNNIDQHLIALQFPQSAKWIFGICGSDRIASKSHLAYTIRQMMPAAISSTIIPESFIIEHESDMKRFVNRFSPSNVYILKKNIQQQKDILITNNLEIILARCNDYVIIQKMLQNPLIIKNRKCNMRVYVLFVINNNNKLDVYYYNDGFMYYTVEPFKKNTLRKEETITTGLAGRDMYKDRPLTHQDLYKYLNPPASKTLQNNLFNIVRYMKDTFESILMEDNKHIPGIKFSVFGMDIAPDENLGCSIMEVNKGPDLTPKDARDKELKCNMVTEMFSIVGILKENEKHNGFIHV